ncbi:MAG: protein phosphatase 2C domain-containing protein [Deltaproteobacteria bacterium]|nr:protein phosphatase 2C domain-containing protein [Deltaproteobacteria bacterium]
MTQPPSDQPSLGSKPVTQPPSDQPQLDLKPTVQEEEVDPGKDAPLITLTLSHNGDINRTAKGEIVTQIKHMIDNFDNIQSVYKKTIQYTLKFNKNFIVTGCEANEYLKKTLGISIKYEQNGVLTLLNIPKDGYEGKLYFKVIVKELLNGRPDIGTFEKNILIAPDPKSLWNDKPVLDYEGYKTPDEATDYGEIPEISKVVIAASCRGRSHAHIGKPRDDSFAFKIDPVSGWNIVAVADGAGSAKYSRKGSEIACQTVVTRLMEFYSHSSYSDIFTQNESEFLKWKDDFNKTIATNYLESDSNYRKMLKYDAKYRSALDLDKYIYNTVYQAYMNIYNEAKAKNASVRDYHTTLLFLAFKKFPFGYFYSSFWIGDGAMAIYNLNNSGKVLTLGIPDSGEYSGQTIFLTMVEEIKPELVGNRTCFGFMEDFEALILVSDGVTDPFFPSEASVAQEENWKRFWNQTLKQGDEENPGCPKVFEPQTPLAEKAKDLREWLDFWSKGNHDDRTILIVK